LTLCCVGCITPAAERAASPSVKEAGSGTAGRDYFVDQRHASASDDNPGTEQRPFKSIRGALTKVQLEPGESLWIKDGVYREFVWFEPRPFLDYKPWTPVIQTNVGLSSAECITLSAFPGHAPVIKGSDLVTGWTRFRDNIWVTPWEHNSQQVFADDRVLRQIGGEPAPHLSGRRWRGRLGNGIDDMFAGSFYYDLEAKQLYVWLENDQNPNTRCMEVSVRPGAFWLGPKTMFYAYMRIIGLRFRHCNSTVFKGSPMVTLTGRHNVMERCDASWSDGGGASAVGDDLAIVHCTFNHNGIYGLGASLVRGLRVIDCETSYNNYRRWNASWSAGGCKFIPACHDMIVRGHTAAENIDSCGIWFDGAMSNVTIENCLAYRNGRAGIMYEIGSRGVIKNNICYENGHRGIYISDSCYTTVLNNLCYRNGMSGIAVVGVDRPGGLHGRGAKGVHPGGNNVVWGNLLIDNCWPKLAPKGWAGRPELLMPPEEGVHVGNVSNYNLFYRSGERGTQPLPFGRNYDVGFATSLQDWREKTGMDTHSVIARPLFKDEARYDFHPLEESPALLMVKPDMSVRSDYDNLPRPAKLYHTAGPFRAPVELVRNIETKPRLGTFSMVVPGDIRRAGRHREHSTLAAYFAIRSKHGRIAPGIYGIRVGGVPFRFEMKKDLLIDGLCRRATVTIGRQVRTLHFLCMDTRASDRPIARCVVHLSDGTDRSLEWKCDARGNLTSTPARDTETRQVAKSKDLGYAEFLKRKTVKIDYRIYMTTWRNDNEWYAVKTLDFENLDPEATLCVFAITSEDLPVE